MTAPRLKAQPLCSVTSEALAAIDSIWKLPATIDKGPGSRRPSYSGASSFVSKDSSVTVLWNRTMWDRHKSRKRYWRAITLFPQSTILRGLLPVVASFTIWAFVVWQFKFTFTSSALSYLSSPLSLMLAFRVNSVVSRFHEARQQWGQLTHKARDIAGVLAACDQVDEHVRARCCRLLVAFGWATKAHSRFETDADAVVDALLPKEEAAKVNGSRKPALALLSLLRKETVSLNLPSAPAKIVQEGLSELNRLVGGMERLMSTPLSPTYMRHTSRGLLIWLAMLPPALMSAGCATLPKLLIVTSATAYIMLGIDEIGIQIEQPFDILPLHGLANVLTKDVQDELLQEL